MKKLLKIILIILFYPIAYLYLMSHVKKGASKTIRSLVAYILLFGIWCMGFFTVYGSYVSDTPEPVKQADTETPKRKTVNRIGRSAILNMTTETTTETTTAPPTTTTTTEATTEPPTAPNELYNIDCNYNYNGKLKGEKGKYSGLWQDLEQKVNQSDADWTVLKEWVGDTSELRQCNYEEDNFEKINGYGTVNWSQAGHEWYYPYSVSGYSSWQQASCGVCAVASVLSTLSGTAVTPPETALATNVLIGDSAWSGDVILTSGQAELIRLAGFRADTVPYSEATQEKMDDCLNNNGMVIFATSSQTWASGGNHYIVVRNMKDGMYYTSDSGKNPTTGFTYNEIAEGYNQQEIVYVYPKNIK